MSYKGEPLFYAVGDFLAKSIRGGNFLAFPNFGPDALLGQHGFARNNAWTWDKQTENSVELSFKPGNVKDRELDNLYPYDFENKMNVSVGDKSIKYDFLVKNNGDKKLPTTLGFHPFFAIDNDIEKQVTTNLEGFNLEGRTWEKEKDDHLSKPLYDVPEDGCIEINVPGKGTFKMNVSSEFKKVLVWKEPGANFLCFEP
ncbi:hypothetical protein COZ22_04295 [bacterium (Candidatus Howlettbacteria) CG_4_10_14_3_um_filter_37_10]|nr:MAG: hypothetical protein COX25_01960 [bacterium (Candidatus Howlettbacteria) CG23_combo_of_CG06-09_8_20_14_all_37_9]PIX98730.1 MAG: hypothetical protein COZ22_04295 [bacterium (Candidatus Howlettbacteria) CG_4_10_14_3_um_filter_37_10]